MPARRLDEATPDQHQRDSAAQEEHSIGGGHRDSMAMTERDQSRKRWTHFATIGLGLWLASSPLIFGIADADSVASRSEEHTSELQSLMRISYAVFCLKKKNYTIKAFNTCLLTVICNTDKSTP